MAPPRYNSFKNQAAANEADDGFDSTYAQPPAAEIANVNAVLAAAPFAIPAPALPPTTNLFPFVPVTQPMLRNFINYCAPPAGAVPIPLTPVIATNIVAVTDAYLRQICHFWNSIPPVRITAAAQPKVLYVPSNVWLSMPAGFGPRPPGWHALASAALTAGGITPDRIKGAKQIFFHIVDHRVPGPPAQPHSSLICITYPMRQIDHLDSELHHPAKLVIGDILNLLAVHIPNFDIEDWTEIRTCASEQSTLVTTASQVWTCTNAVTMAFGYKLKKNNLPAMAENVLMNRKARVIVADLIRGHFSGTPGMPGYRPHQILNYGLTQERESASFRNISRLYLQRLTIEQLGRWASEGVHRNVLLDTLKAQCRANRGLYGGFAGLNKPVLILFMEARDLADPAEGRINMTNAVWVINIT